MDLLTGHEIVMSEAKLGRPSSRPQQYAGGQDGALLIGLDPFDDALQGQVLGESGDRPDDRHAASRSASLR